MTPTADRARGCPNMAAGRIISGSLTLLLLLVQPTHGLGGTRWATPDVEALDERRDAEIFQAVVDSMAEWQRRRDHKTSGRERRAADSVVCYEGVGCFRDAGPFSYLDMLPSPPDQVATHFLFYPPRHPHRAHPLPFANITTAPAPDSSPAPDPLPAAPAAPRRPARDSPPTISTSLSASPSDAAFVPATAFGPADWLHAGLNTTAPTKVIVHGFGSSCSNVWVFEMRSALMSVEDCNVICVDWEAGATIPNYVRAAANTRLVGKQLALLLTRLRDELGLDLHSVHLIGFSLGAHVAGFAGAELRDLISRITGLDPAGPLFENQDPAARLDASDAAFVDVIHSNGENLILGGLGSWQPMGHVDFYPNGGRMQKGCSNLFVGAVSDIFWSSREAHGRSLCNHRRAYKFFTDSVSPRCHFPAVPCESYDQFLLGECFPCSSQRHCGNMGYYADRSGGRGSLYLVTRDEEPFCAHQFLIRVESTPSALPVVSYGKLQVTLLGSAPQANETFTMTRKDDEELRAGGVLSRIVVPHPVMEEGPAQVELLYAAYSGWISSGLAKWSVDKISIGDSFGKSSSFCKRGLILESGVPVTVPVYPGDCNPPPSELTTSSAPPLSTTALAESGDGGPNDKESDAKKPAESTDGGAATTPSPATTRPLTAVAAAAADDGGLDAAKGGLAHEEVTSNGNGGTWRPTDAAAPTTTASPTPPSADPLVGAASGPPDEPRDSWQPLDGGGRRRDEAAAARAFLPRAAKRAPLAGNASILPQPPREWRPRHVPLPLLGRASEPREPWLAEMRPHAAGLDPPPIHAPLTWHHWAATFDEDEGDDEVEEASSTSAPPPSAEEEQRPANNSWALGPVIETVQLLPQRLVAFLARAEEYARVTLSGMVLGAAGNATTAAVEGAAGAAEGAASARRRAKLFPEEATSVGAMGRGLAHLYSSGAVVGGRELAEEASEAGHRPRYIPLQRPPEEAARRRSAGRAPSFPMPRRR